MRSVLRLRSRSPVHYFTSNGSRVQIKIDKRQNSKQESLSLASTARDDLHVSSTAAKMRGKVGSEFET